MLVNNYAALRFLHCLTTLQPSAVKMELMQLNIHALVSRVSFYFKTQFVPILRCYKKSSLRTF